MLSTSVCIALMLDLSLSNTHLPSSLSSCFCGHKICLSLTARIIMPKTNAQTMSSSTMKMHPTIWIGLLFNANPTAKVPVYSTVSFFTRKEHHNKDSPSTPC